MAQMKIIFGDEIDLTLMIETKCPKDIYSEAKELLECECCSGYPNKCMECWDHSGIELEVTDEQNNQD